MTGRRVDNATRLMRAEEKRLALIAQHIADGTRPGYGTRPGDEFCKACGSFHSAPGHSHRSGERLTTVITGYTSSGGVGTSPERTLMIVRAITLHGDKTGWLGEHLVENLTKAERNNIVAVARRLAKEAAERLNEPVEARVERRKSIAFAVRHVPGVTS